MRDDCAKKWIAMHRGMVVACMIATVCACMSGAARGEAVEISSLGELADYAGRDGNSVRMKPGVYRLIDHLPREAMAERRARKAFAFITFGGSDNVFELEGVTIEVDTTLRNDLRPPIHTNEFLVSGDRNMIKGLEIRHLGDGTSPGGAMIGITGTGNTLRGCTFRVRGSFPYGYGDLFGKGGPNVINPRKKSGVLVAGDKTRVVGCRLYMRSFGHGYYIQKDAAEVSFEDCYVEGEMRPTDAMLAERSGPAFDVKFRTVGRNREGEHRVMPGYMKSLAEDGFRTYGQHRKLSFRNCTAKNMRGGFELRTKEGVRLENCTAVGNERGFWVSSGASVVNCRGDAQYGPLLFVEGDGASVEVELLAAESVMTVHALATIHGSGHQVRIVPAKGRERTRAAPILFGYGTPGAGEGMAPIPEREARKVRLGNETTMPVVIGAKAREGEVVTRGLVRENAGEGVVVRQK